MTSIQNPTAAQITNGDVVTIRHAQLPQPLVLQYADNGFTLPGLGERYSARDLSAAGYTFESLERPEVRLVDGKVAVAEGKLEFSLQRGNLTVTLVNAKGGRKQLGSQYISGYTNGTREVPISTADIAG